MFAHIDVDAFFASVLVRQDPRLRGRPLLALGMGGGCVIAASYEAKAKGVQTGMRVTEAKKLCPEATQRLANFAEACRASVDIEAILMEQCPAMERMSVDEWFLDLRSLVGGTPNDLGTWASEIQRTVQAHLSLSVSVGIGPTKTLAKMASEYRKPAGITVLISSEGNPSQCSLLVPHSSFLKDRPAAAIPGIGHARSKHTERHGWRTAWDFAQAPEEIVGRLFGKPGRELRCEVRGTPVYGILADDRPPQSLSRCRSFRHTHRRAIVYSHLLEHLQILVRKMRKEQQSCLWVYVWTRDRNYISLKHHCKLSEGMDTEEALLPYVRECFDRLWTQQEHATQVGLALTGLHASRRRQYSLFEVPERTEEREQIQRTLDMLQERFGRGAVVRGPQIELGHSRKSVRTVYGDLF
jgi:nucleotidyltransferase/DNA polymerase involved in DNA repair